MLRLQDPPLQKRKAVFRWKLKTDTGRKHNKYFLLNRIHESRSLLNHHYTHEEEAATKNTCLWVKTKRRCQGACSLRLCRLSFCSPKPNANEARSWNFKIFIYACLLSCTCLILPFLFLLLLFLGNMQSLSGLHPDFHVRPWLLDWDADRRWKRLKSQVEAEWACRVEPVRWRPCLLIRPDVLLMPALHYKYF